MGQHWRVANREMTDREEDVARSVVYGALISLCFIVAFLSVYTYFMPGD